MKNITLELNAINVETLSTPLQNSVYIRLKNERNMSVWNVVKPSSKSLSSLYTREHIQERSHINALNVVKPSAGRQSLVYICKLNEE